VDLHDGVVDPTAGSARHGTEWRRWCEGPFTGGDGQQPGLVIWSVQEIDARLSVDVGGLSPSSRQCRQWFRRREGATEATECPETLLASRVVAQRCSVAHCVRPIVV
jgi:hypothetical protein